jgi:hypothetical protein
MIAGQKNCACCEKPFEEPYRLYVVLDHNHSTGAERGLICQSCNKIVSLVENDPAYSGKGKDSAIQYLKRANNCAVTLPKRDSNHQVTQSDTDTEKKKRHASRAPLVDSEWIEDLKTQPAYKNLNVDLLLNRMQNWCAVRKLQPTRRRFINWLNKEDKPLAHTPARPVYGKNRLPPTNGAMTAEEMQHLRDAAREETEKLRKKLNP